MSSVECEKWLLAWACGWIAICAPAWAQGDKPVYRCPGKPVLYTDSLSAKEAKDKGCTALDGGPITVISAPVKARAGATGNGGGKPATSAAGHSGDSRVDPGEQRSRDSDARKILEAELRKEEDSLAVMKKDFNNGEPERQGDERNYQKYLDRVAEMKAGLARKESDIAALKRELSKLN